MAAVGESYRLGGTGAALLRPVLAVFLLTPGVVGRHLGWGRVVRRLGEIRFHLHVIDGRRGGVVTLSIGGLSGVVRISLTKLRRRCPLRATCDVVLLSRRQQLVSQVRGYFRTLLRLMRAEAQATIWPLMVTRSCRDWSCLERAGAGEGYGERWLGSRPNAPRLWGVTKSDECRDGG